METFNVNFKKIAYIIISVLIFAILVISFSSCNAQKKLKKQISELQHLNSEFKANNKELNLQIFDLKNKIEDFKRQNIEFEKNNLNLKAEIGDLRHENILLLNTIKELKNVSQTIDKRFSELLDRLEEYINKLEQF